jgi:hypothetical protein
MPPGGAAPAAGQVVFQIDPAKMPKADALKAFLFPGYMALSADDREIRLVTREAFPDVGSGGPSNSAAASAVLMPAIQKAREAAMKAAAGQGKPAAASPK